MKFKIKRGKHYHSNLLARLGIINFKNELKRVVRFEPSCYYPYLNNDSEDLNKLYGYGAYDHHMHSVRFAWKPDFEKDGYIRIFAYWYEANQRGMREICSVKIRETTVFSIKRDSNVYTLSVGGRNTVVRFEKKRPIWRKGQPYFGGNNRAPHEMIIYLKKY